MPACQHLARCRSVASTLVALLAFTGCAPAARAAAGAASVMYPHTPRGDTVDMYHGVRVADPYRWLEALDTPATREWVAAQNRLAEPWLEAIPARAAVKARLTELWNYERFGIPVKRGGRYFYLHNDGRQNQSALYVSESATAPARVLYDPNPASQDATVSLARFEPSPDGRILAYGLSDGGTDWEIWHFRRVDDGVDLPDVLVRTKFWEVSWAKDGSGVYYDLYAARADGHGDDAARPDIRFHRLGEPQANDRLVYAVENHPARVPSGFVTDDGRYLVITLFDGYEKNGVQLLDLAQPAVARPLFDAWDALYTFAGSQGEELYFQTTNSAARGRVIAIDAARPEPAAWRTVIPESADAIESTSYVGGRIVVRYVRDAHGAVRVYERDGRVVGEVPLAGLGTVDGFAGRSDDPETFFSYADYLRPAQIYRFDAASNTASVFRAPQVAFDASRYITEQVFFRSKDGTRVPMYITHRRGMRRDGNQPTLLYGYGGFAVSLTPAFRASTLAWLEMGGVYAEANLRGGGEYGEAWHQGGTRARKQNVFDDFIAAAQYLIHEHYTRPARLAITGRSNGGLLVGAALLQRPDLFGAALPAVGVLDMLRYHTASANARQWSSDFGISEDAADFAALRRYSPVHNVRPGTCYPPTLVTTADRDDRVVPWHSYKFAAALQRVQRPQTHCENPVLIRIETRAGHGAGKPVWMQIEDFADQWAFAARALGMPAGAERPAAGAEPAP
ncbi:MAG: prolyl oligopeptidase family serine peptidase [Steroidobacteraceae bacterium]